MKKEAQNRKMGAGAETLPRYAGLKVSAAEYRNLTEDGFRYDHIDGTLQLSPSPHFPHSQSLAALIAALQNYVRPEALGLVLPELDVFLPDEGDVLRPDVSVVLRERRHIVRECIFGAPDLVFEVLSPGTRARDLGPKARRYLENGVREYWLIDPDERRIEQRVNRGKVWFARGGRAAASSALPGFTLAADDLFLDL